jgi:dihydrofolate synthase/folylpolyglutamate synthase
MNDLPATLEGMLERIERRAPRTRVELGLDRVRRVFERLAPDLSATRIVSVAGTNGKGSTVAFLQRIAGEAGIRSVAYTSPHILRFAERVRIDGEPASDDALADALARVERARGEAALTWFEHVTLAALTLAGDVRPDWLIAEVGMGGRLDAVNVLDADVAVITSIGLDHQRWLGRTRAAIAREKCGIARSGRPVVVGEKRRPDGMTRHLQRIGATALLAGRDFDWRWRRGSVDIDLGPDAGAARLADVRPGLPGRHQAANAASAAAAASLLSPRPDRDALVRGLERARLAGRFQRIARDPDVIVDVAHNPAAVRMLRSQLAGLPGRKLAVFAALDDKDVAGMVRALRGTMARWFVAGLDAPRGLDAATLAERVIASDAEAAPEALESVADALAAARAHCGRGDLIVVFGSFLTAQAAMAAHRPRRSD